jgi:hypothetical protein
MKFPIHENGQEKNKKWRYKHLGELQRLQIIAEQTGAWKPVQEYMRSVVLCIYIIPYHLVSTYMYYLHLPYVVSIAIFLLSAWTENIYLALFLKKGLKGISSLVRLRHFDMFQDVLLVISYWYSNITLDLVAVASAYIICTSKL